MSRAKDRAAREFAKLHWGDEATEELEIDRVAAVRDGDVLTALGTLELVAYGTAKAGEDAEWHHRFKGQKPILAVTADGDLVVVGGSYRVSERGIVG